MGMVSLIARQRHHSGVRLVSPHAEFKPAEIRQQVLSGISANLVCGCLVEKHILDTRSRWAGGGDCDQFRKGGRPCLS